MTSQFNQDVEDIYGINVETFLKEHNATALRIMRDYDTTGGGPDTDCLNGRITVVVTKADEIVRITEVWSE